MIQGMTGFGTAERDVYNVEIRSVNHRFMDISVKIPQYLSRHEIPLRNILKEKFSRGRFDIVVSVADRGNAGLHINMAKAREVYHALDSLRQELSLPGRIGIDAILGFRELILHEDRKGGHDAGALYEAFDEALSGLYKMRLKEGRVLKHDLILRADRIEALRDEVLVLCSNTVSAFRDRLLERLHDLFGELKYDEARLLQEAALIAERADISEETTRLGFHISQMRKILSGGVTIGRQAEFILQELNREVNTIASKSDDYRISKIAVELKSELEKMREQAQNIQ